MSADTYIKILVSLAASIVMAYVLTPVVMRLAKKIGAIDVPLDNRRMHTHPVPRLGGLAIIGSFLVTTLIILRGNQVLMQIWPGAIIIGILGVVDDKYRLPAWPKFLVQCVAAALAVAQGAQIDHISGIQMFGIHRFSLGVLDIPITILWIVGITNAVNLIDGLDGLADGVSTIASMSIFLIALLRNEPIIAVLAAALAGSCVGLLPYNRNPAKIFMGDTGATFLGFTLSIISIEGLFKFYTAISFAVPFLILGIPILDTFLAIIRRLLEGKSPFTADRNHLHHQLIDMGFNQKQSVAVLYSVSAVLGIVAVVSSVAGSKLSWLLFFMGVVIIFGIYFYVVHCGRRHQKDSKTDEKPAKQSETPPRGQDPSEHHHSG